MFKSRFIQIAAIVGAALLVIAAGLRQEPAPGMSTDITLEQFLTWLASAGGASIILSFVAERVPAFQKLTGAQRGYVQMGGSALLALAAYAVLAYVPAAALAQIAPFFRIVYGVAGAWVANQIAHGLDPEQGRPQ